MYGRGFVGIVDGFRSSGKSKVLLQMALNLIQSRELARKKDIKILVTALSKSSVDTLALKLKEIRASHLGE